MNKKIPIILIIFMLMINPYIYAQSYIDDMHIEDILSKEFSWKDNIYKMINSSTYTMMSSQKGFKAHTHYILKHKDGIVSYGITIFDSSASASSAMEWRIQNVASFIALDKTYKDIRIDKLWRSSNGIFMLKGSIILEATIAENELLFALLNKALTNIENFKNNGEHIGVSP